MDLGLRSSRALITGGSRGIGLAIAEALAAEGVAVGLVARDRDGLAAAAGRLAGRGATVATAVADVTDTAELGRAVDEIATALGEPASRSKIARRVGSARAASTASWLVMTYRKLQLTDVPVNGPGFTGSKWRRAGQQCVRVRPGRLPLWFRTGCWPEPTHDGAILRCQPGRSGAATSRQRHVRHRRL